MSSPAVELSGSARCEATFIAPALTSEEQEAEDGSVLTFQLVVSDPDGFFDEDSTVVNVSQVEDDQQNTHKTSGCFVQTLSDLTY